MILVFQLVLLCNLDGIIYTQNNFSSDDIEDSFITAKAIFEKHVNCKVPKNVTVKLYDSTIRQMNIKRNVFIYGVAIGLYNPTTNSIIISKEYKYRKKVLFHEFLHLMFDRSIGCAGLWSEGKQHEVIYEMEEVYLKQKGLTREQVNNSDWLFKIIW